MSAISLKSITGITSITTPAGVDNQLTLHTNNTTERLRIDSSGRVLIGGSSNSASSHADELQIINTSAQGGLSIINASNGQGNIYFGHSGGTADGRIEYSHSGDYMRLFTANTERLRITSGGVVNIGGDYTQTSYKFNVQGTARFKNSEADIWLESTGVNKIWRILGSTGGNTHQFRIYDQSNSSDRFVIDSSGNVGINDTSPDTRLTVNSGTTNVVAKFTSTDQYAWAQFRDNTTTDTAVMIGADGDDLLLRAGSNERLRIKSGGNVKFATNNSASDYLEWGGNPRLWLRCPSNMNGLRIDASTTPLEIKNSSNNGKSFSFDGNFNFNVNGDYSLSSGQYDSSGKIFLNATRHNGSTTVTSFQTSIQAVALSDTNNDGYLGLGASAHPDDLVIKTNGNIGIGITDPQRLLHLQSSGDTLARITSADGSAAYLELGDVSDPDGGKIVYDSGSNLEFYTASNPRLRITSDGSVGIGTYAPQDALTLYDSDNNVGLYFQSPNTGNGGGDGFRIGRNDTHAFLWNYENQDIALATNGSERLRIENTGATRLIRINTFPNPNNTGSEILGSKLIFGNNIIFEERYPNGAYSDRQDLVLRTNTGYGQGLSDKIRFTAGGTINFEASGGGLHFGAMSHAAGMSSETLDDYEEGTFTPYIDREHNTPIIGYAAQDGYYTKIGRVVYFYAEVRINSYNGNGSYGNTYLRGLPFQSAARTGGRGVWNSVTYHSYYRDIDSSASNRDIAVVQGSSEMVVFYVMRSENSWTSPPAPDANDQFKIGGFYFT